MDGTIVIPQFALKSDNKYILKKHSSGFFYILRNGAMTKSLSSPRSSQPSSCEAEKEEIQGLKTRHLICELESISYLELLKKGSELVDFF